MTKYVSFQCCEVSVHPEPSSTKCIFVTHLPKGVVTPPSLWYRYKGSDSYDFGTGGTVSIPSFHRYQKKLWQRFISVVNPKHILLEIQIKHSTPRKYQYCPGLHSCFVSINKTWSRNIVSCIIYYVIFWTWGGFISFTNVFPHTAWNNYIQ